MREELPSLTMAMDKFVVSFHCMCFSYHAQVTDANK